jgi:hypothetical protein
MAMGEEGVCGLVQDVETHGGGCSMILRFCQKSLLQGKVRVWCVVDKFHYVDKEIIQALVIGAVKMYANRVVPVVGCDFVEIDPGISP